MTAAPSGRLLGLLAAALWLIAAAPPLGAEGTGLFNTTRLLTVKGAEIYALICQGCHMPDGRGASGAGHYPALARNPALRSAHYMAQTIIEGRRNMPSFGAHDAGAFFFSQPSLSDVQVAAVINYVRTHFGNHYTDAISADEVGKLRVPR